MTSAAGSTIESEITSRFERGEVSAEDFHHADHVRLAFAYLSQFPVLIALAKFSTGLKRFAAVHGKPQLFNETMTCAYFFLIRERMARSGQGTWEEFAVQNPDLLIWKGGILSHYYLEATLTSEIARRVFVLPDKCLQQKPLLEVASHRR